MSIKRLPILDGNSLSVNLLLLLGVLAFAIITIDFNTELSVQKDEITQVVATLDESIGTLQLDALDNTIIDPPVIGTISETSDSKPENEAKEPPSDRSPPSGS